MAQKEEPPPYADVATTSPTDDEAELPTTNDTIVATEELPTTNTTTDIAITSPPSDKAELPTTDGATVANEIVIDNAEVTGEGTELTEETEKPNNKYEPLNIFGKPYSKTREKDNCCCWSGHNCQESVIMVKKWPNSLKLFCVIGTLLFYVAFIGVIEGPALFRRGNEFKQHAHRYPFEIQCLITEEQSIESSIWGCNHRGDTGSWVSQSPLYEDFVYYVPKCTMINLNFSDAEQHSIQVGDSCEDEFDSEAASLRDRYLTHDVPLNSSIDCYTNSNCSAITFQDYIRWEEYQSTGVAWITVSAVFTFAVLCWWSYEYCKKDKVGAKQCCYCGCVNMMPLLLLIYGVFKVVIAIEALDLKE